MLNNTWILIFSVLALFSAFFARINVAKTFSVPLLIISFVAVAFCITYSFLLGVDINDILTYILVYTVVTATVFWDNEDKNDVLPIEYGVDK